MLGLRIVYILAAKIVLKSMELSEINCSLNRRLFIANDIISNYAKQ